MLNILFVSYACWNSFAVVRWRVLVMLFWLCCLLGRFGLSVFRNVVEFGQHVKGSVFVICEMSGLLFFVQLMWFIETVVSGRQPGHADFTVLSG